MPVLVAVDRSGTTFSTVLPTVTADTLKQAINPVVDRNIVLVSDGCQSYRPCAAAMGVRHESPNLSAGERIRGAFHIQTVNSRHSQLKDFLRRYYERLEHLKLQIDLLLDFFKEQEHVTQLLETYSTKVEALLSEHPNCDEKLFTAHFGDSEAFARKPELTVGLGLLPAFSIDDNGQRSMASMAFPRDQYLIGCPAARGSIDIMTIQQNGEMTPCCDVGNLKCKPTFGNLLMDSPKEIMEKNARIHESTSIRNSQKS